MQITTLEMIQELLRDKTKVFESKNCYGENVVAKFGEFIDTNTNDQNVGIYLCHNNKKVCSLEVTFGWTMTGIMTWLWEEVDQTDWSRVEVDTPILVSDDGKEWHKRHFSGYDNIHGEVCAWSNGKTSWSIERAGEFVDWPYAKLAERDI